MVLKPSDIQTPGPGSDPGVHAEPLRIRDPRPQAMQELAQAQANFGQAMHSLGNAALQWKEKREAAEDGVFIDKWQLEKTKAGTVLDAEAVNNPSDDPNFIYQHDERHAELDKQIEDDLKGQGYSISTEGERRLRQVQYNMRTSSARAVAIAQNNARVTKIMDTNTANITEIAKDAWQDPEAALARVDASIDAINDTIPYDKRTDYRNAAHFEVYQGAVDGLIRQAEAATDPAVKAQYIAKARAITDTLLGGSPQEAPEAVPGMVGPGNIDINNRKVGFDDKGRPMTVKSMGIEIDGHEVLIPTVADGREMTLDEAVQRYRVTHEHLGIFDSEAAATAYAKKLSGRQDALLSGKLPRVISGAIIDKAKAAGVDPALVAAISWMESKFNPMALNEVKLKNGKTSRAYGLFQFIASTAEQYGLPSDARKASVLQQAEAGAKLMADSIRKIKQATGTDPTPGEVYLAHFLGVDAALRVMQVSPDTPLSKLISADAIEANSMRGWNAAQIQQWAEQKMQVGLEYVSDGGFIEGRKIDHNEAGLPIAKVATLASSVHQAEEALRREEEAKAKKLQDMFDLSKAPKDRDPAGYVAEESPEVQRAFDAAVKASFSVDATPEQKTEAWEDAVDTSIKAQMSLPGADESRVKVLPNAQAKRLVQTFSEAPGPQARQAFYDLKGNTGKHWDRVFNELVEQGLPETYHILKLLDPTKDVTEIDALTQGLNQKEADLTKDIALPPSLVKEQITDPLEEKMGDFLQTYETGYGAETRAQTRGLMQAITNAALVHYRAHRDPQAAVDFAASILPKHLDAINSGNVTAIVPKEENLSGRQVENAALAAQSPERIKEWNPVLFGDGSQAPRRLADAKEGDFDLNRTMSAATNTNSAGSYWTTNQAGDGLVLWVRLGGLSASPLVRPKPGDPTQLEFYEIKFKDVPELAKEGAVKLNLQQPQLPGAGSYG